MTDFYSWLDSSGSPTYNNVATWAHAQYNYDHTDQLASSGGTAAVQYSNWQNAPADKNYSYDANGNRSGGGNMTGPGNQTWEDAAGNEYWYDNEGDRMREDLADDAGTILYTYDNRHRLASEAYGAYDGEGQFQATETISYTYDVFDRLVGKTVTGSKTDKEVYVYDGENMILKFQNSTGAALTNSNLVRRFLNGAAVDQVFAEEVTAGGSSVQTRWLLADNEGTIRDVATYAAGVTTVQDHLVYDSFGNVVHQSNSADAPTFSYTGQMYDADAKAYHCGVRWYDPQTGQFLSHDPLGFAAGDPNLYRYCGNGPTNFTDPSGMYQSGGASGGGGGWSGNTGTGASGGEAPAGPEQVKKKKNQPFANPDNVQTTDYLIPLARGIDVAVGTEHCGRWADAFIAAIREKKYDRGFQITVTKVVWEYSIPGIDQARDGILWVWDKIFRTNTSGVRLRHVGVKITFQDGTYVYFDDGWWGGMWFGVTVNNMFLEPGNIWPGVHEVQ